LRTKAHSAMVKKQRIQTSGDTRVIWARMVASATRNRTITPLYRDLKKWSTTLRVKRRMPATKGSMARWLTASERPKICQTMARYIPKTGICPLSISLGRNREVKRVS